MADFWTNMNKGIDQIVPFALKKMELDDARAKTAMQMQQIEKHNQLLDEQIAHKRADTEREAGLRAKLQEMIGMGVPGKATVNVRDLLMPGGGGDVDQGFSTTGLPAMRQEEQTVMRKPTAEELVMGSLPYSDPAHALTAMSGLSKSEEQQKNLMARVEMQLQNTRDISDAKLKMAEVVANLNNSGRRDVALLRALKKGGGEGDRILDYQRVSNMAAVATGNGEKDPSPSDLEMVRMAARKVGYDFVKAPGKKYHREILGMTIPGSGGEEGGGWQLVPLGDVGGETPGKKQVGTSNGKPVYDLGDGKWQIGD